MNLLFELIIIINMACKRNEYKSNSTLIPYGDIINGTSKCYV